MINRQALLHALRGLPEPADVPVGTHDLSGVDVLIRFPAGAGITRAEGTAGNGYDHYTATSKGVSLSAIMTFVHRSGALANSSKNLWMDCIRESIEAGDKVEYPPEAIEALDALKLELRSSVPSTRKTQARRVKVTDAQIAQVKSVPIDAHSIHCILLDEPRQATPGQPPAPLDPQPDPQPDPQADPQVDPQADPQVEPRVA